MGQESLVRDETDAGAELVRLFDQYAPVKAAFWVKESEKGRWYLYITSDQIDYDNMGLAYGEIMRLANQNEDPFLDPYEVKLVPTSDPLARAILEIHRKFPGLKATRLGPQMLGGMGVEGVFLYPLLVGSPN